MTREEMDFIGGMNMCDEISNEAYKKIMCHCEEQEPKTGHWVEKNVRGFELPYCSECGSGLDVIYHYPFCPNCGAKMESEDGE